MATKSGQLRQKDIFSGKIAYFVDVEPNADGGFVIKPPLAILIKTKPQRYEMQVEHLPTGTMTYPLSFAFDFLPLGDEESSRSFMTFKEVGMPHDDEGPDPFYRNRLFNTKKQALKFIADFTDTATENEIKDARSADVFISCMLDKPIPEYPPIPAPSPVTYRNKKRFLRRPNTVLRRMGWEHDNAPVNYLQVELDSNYGIAQHEYMITRPAGSLPFDEEALPTDKEIELANYVLSLPGVGGRHRRSKRQLKRLYKSINFAEVFFPTVNLSPTEEYLEGTAVRDAHFLAHDPVTNHAGLVGLPKEPSALVAFVDEHISERAKVKQEILDHVEKDLIDRVKAGQYVGVDARDPYTYKFLENKGDVPPKPNEAS